MSPARLLEHFDRLIDTPDAVPRLRRFILDLAVRGKLVEQDPKDDPAGELLKRIAKEKARLMKDGSLRQQEAQPLAKEDVPFDLPAGWRWTQLAEIGVVNPRCRADDSVAASFVPMPMISAKYGQPHEHEVRQWGEIKKGFTQFAEGDVGLAKITPCFENGKSTVFRGLTGGLGAGTTELHVLRPVFVPADYILVFLKSSHFIETGIPKMTGTAGQKRVSRDYFAFSPVPLPPLAEQHRIVAKVDELMALCDELEAAQTKREKRRDRLVAATLHGLNNGNAGRDGSPSRPDHPHPNTGGFGETALPGTFEESARFYFNHLPRLTTRPEHIHQLRQTILNLAVRGRLVPQENTGTITADMLSRIQAEKSRLATGSRLKKDKMLAGVPDDQLPFPIPGNWEWVKVGSLSSLVEYGTSVKSNSQETGVPVLRMGDIQDGRVSLAVQKTVPRSIPDLPRLFLKHMDILYNRTNSAELVGKTGIFLGEDDTYTFASYLIRIRVLEVIADPTYVNLAMNASYFRETQILPQLQQQCGQANVNGTKLRNMLIPLPPITEQHRIVAKVDELMALCNGVEAGLTSSAARRGKCLESMLGESLKRIATMAV